MSHFSLINYLKSNKKEHLISFFSNLPDLASIDQEILKLDLMALEKQIHLFQKNSDTPIQITPFNQEIASGNAEKQELGKEIVSSGKVACLLIAGGQGTRLNHSGPKGTYPISLRHKKSLFQLFAEKVKAASTLFKRELPVAIMTSPLNDAETKNFFQKHGCFGLNPSQIDFFSQTMLPLLDFNQQLFLSDRSQIASGPDGNGSCFKALVDNGIIHKWKSMGVEYINVVLVDNPLADPFDFELIGHLALSQDDVTLKSCYRKHKDEQVGIIVLSHGKPIVVEYHEIPKEWTFQKEPCANLSLMALTLNFAEKIASYPFPLHKVQKKFPYYNFQSEQILQPATPNAWKFEYYIFDMLDQSCKTSVLIYPREEIFSPLKAVNGEGSVQSVEQALLNKERKLYEKISGLKAPNAPFELPASFYYPTEELKQYWQGKEIDSTNLG